jgi:hypothetical protein
MCRGNVIERVHLLSDGNWVRTCVLFYAGLLAPRGKALASWNFRLWSTQWLQFCNMSNQWLRSRHQLTSIKISCTARMETWNS